MERKPSPTYSPSLQRFLQKLTVITSDVYGLDKTFRVIQYTAHLISIYTPTTSSLHRASKRSIGPFSEARFALRLFSTIHLLTLPRTCSQRLLLVYAVSEVLFWLGQHQIVSHLKPAPWSRLSCFAWTLWILLQLRDPKHWPLQITEFPMAVHWSLSTPLLGDTAVAWLGWIGGCTGFLNAWNNVKL